MRVNFELALLEGILSHRCDSVTHLKKLVMMSLQTLKQYKPYNFPDRLKHEYFDLHGYIDLTELDDVLNRLNDSNRLMGNHIKFLKRNITSSCVGVIRTVPTIMGHLDDFTDYIPKPKSSGGLYKINNDVVSTIIDMYTKPTYQDSIYEIILIIIDELEIIQNIIRKPDSNENIIKSHRASIYRLAGYTYNLLRHYHIDEYITIDCLRKTIPNYKFELKTSKNLMDDVNRGGTRCQTRQQ